MHCNGQETVQTCEISCRSLTRWQALSCGALMDIAIVCSLRSRLGKWGVILCADVVERGHFILTDILIPFQQHMPNIYDYFNDSTKGHPEYKQACQDQAPAASVILFIRETNEVAYDKSKISSTANLSWASLRLMYITKSSLTSCKAVEHSSAQSIGFRNVDSRVHTVHKTRTSSHVRMLPPAYNASRRYKRFSEPLAAVEANSTDRSLSLPLSTSPSTLRAAAFLGRLLLGCM